MFLEQQALQTVQPPGASGLHSFGGLGGGAGGGAGVGGVGPGGAGGPGPGDGAGVGGHSALTQAAHAGPSAM